MNNKPRTTTPRRQFFWLVTHGEDNRPFLLFGSDRSEADARLKGLELLPNNDFEIKKLPTRDQGKASALIRGKRLEQTHDLKTATERIGHEKSLKRLKKKHRFGSENSGW